MDMDSNGLHKTKNTEELICKDTDKTANKNKEIKMDDFM
jgi:hypothetical protein